MSEIVLSIGMIVKNEIRCLEKCLIALEPLRQAVPSELVIADTGSTDGTREVAARYADQLFDFAWNDDFAEARNAVLSKCSGQWYLSVDADEYLDKEFDTLVKFLLHPTDNEKRADFGLITIANYRDQALEKDAATSFLALRLARRTAELRYIGKIHEHFQHKDYSGVLNLAPVVFWHDGYAYETPEQRRKKENRNMQLLKEELGKYPTDSLLLVEAIESGRNLDEKLKYIHMGMELMRSNAPDWALQGPSLLRYAVQIASAMGSSDVTEWANWAYTEYGDSPITQIDLNAAMAQYYCRCRQWKQALHASDAYWEGIRKLDCNEFSAGIFVNVLMYGDSQSMRETIALLQAEACYHLDRFDLAVEVLKKIPLHTLLAAHVGQFVTLLAKLADKTSVDNLFIEDARSILGDDPATQNAWRRRDELRDALHKLFLTPQHEIPNAHRILLGLEDEVYGPAAQIMEEECTKRCKQIADTIPDWEFIPEPVICKLVESDVPLPSSFFETVDFEPMQSILYYLVNHLERPLEQLHQFLNEYPADDLTQAVWNFICVRTLCQCSHWKNEDMSEEILSLFYPAARRYLEIKYPPALWEVPAAHAILPQADRFIYFCVLAEEHLQNGFYEDGIQCLRTALYINTGMRKMILFLIKRMERICEERRMMSGVTPELIRMAKQIRAILAQYSEDDPTVFALKQSEQYQKMKFLIEDPNLDAM